MDRPTDSERRQGRDDGVRREILCRGRRCVDCVFADAEVSKWSAEHCSARLTCRLELGEQCSALRSPARMMPFGFLVLPKNGPQEPDCAGSGENKTKYRETRISEDAKRGFYAHQQGRPDD